MPWLIFPWRSADIEPLMADPPTVTINAAAQTNPKRWTNVAGFSEDADRSWLATLTKVTGTGLTDPGSNLQVRLRGIGYPVTRTESGRITVQSGVNYTQNNILQAHGQYAVSVQHTGTQLRLGTFSRAGRYRVRVNGELVTLESNSIGPDLQFRTICLQFATSATRQVDFELYHGVFPFAIECGATETVTTPTWTPTPKLYVIGDSFSDGANSTSKGFRDMVHFAAARLGWDDVTVDGLGGTGYKRQNGAAATPPWDNYADRVPDNLASGKAIPDVVLVIGSVNDKFETTTDVGTNAAALFDYLNDTVPDAPVYAVVFGENQSNTATNAARYAQIEAACDAAPNVAGFLDLTDILTGTGSAGVPEGDGTRDLWLDTDRTHPTLAGHQEYGEQIAAFLEGELGEGPPVEYPVLSQLLGGVFDETETNGLVTTALRSGTHDESLTGGVIY